MGTFQKKLADVERVWHLVDAADIPLGRVATRVAGLLRGKHKTYWAPHLDAGDFVVVVNAAQVKLTGRKLEQKFHRHHSGYPGGLKSTPYAVIMEHHPDLVVHWAVAGMVPKNHLGRQMLKRLRVYAGPEHRHQAQKPAACTLEG
ncbi:MAG: 50S ribosomal protein L13 [bacterium]|nr:50S ribosomal protein L13 [bacterium]